jgi:6-pyruvoyltetrahydropterin/6-carboxytetrahydropterin synthase
MVLDLGYLRAEIAKLRELLDHRFLDEVEDLGQPTLENLCLYIRRTLQPAFPQLCAVLVERQVSGDRCRLRWE